MRLDIKVEHMIRYWVQLEEKRIESDDLVIKTAADRGAANTTPWPVIPSGESARTPETKE